MTGRDPSPLFVGVFGDDRIALTIRRDPNAPGESYIGTIEQGTHTYEVRGTAAGGRLEGQFSDSAGHRFPFSAAMEGNVLVFVTGGTTYRLEAEQEELDDVRPVANPLDEVINPLDSQIAAPPDSAPAATPPPLPANRAAPAKMALAPHTLQDPQLGCPAWAFVAPVDWTSQGAVIWTGHMSPPCVTVLRIANPRGSEEFNLYPTIPFTTGNPQQAFGAACCPYMDPGSCIRQILLPRCRPEAQQGRILGYQETPQLAQQEQARIAGLGMVLDEVRAGRMVVEYARDGRPTLEMFYCITTAKQFSGTLLWSVDIAFSYCADKDKFYGVLPLFNTMARALRENPQWTMARVQRVRAMVNQMYPVRPATPANSGPSILDVSRSMARDQDRFLSHIDQINTDRLNVGQSWTAAFRGSENLVDPVLGETVYNVQDANLYNRMFRTDQGVIYGTNDPSYDPWVNDQIRATELQRGG